MTVTRMRRVDGVADAVGAFSHATIAGGFVYTSGQLPIDASGVIPEGFEAQLDQALANLRILLVAAGTSMQNVVKVNGYLTDPDDLEVYNRVYRRHFGDDLPARTTVCVSLWGVALEIDCVAAIPQAHERGSVDV